MTDDDSWVLDVLDPQTGQPVGLLCREYLRWNQTDTKWDGFDDPTYPGGPDGPMRVNSQAWVFYNLQPDGRTPDLSEGTVLRFVYDVRKNTFRGIADDEDGYAWPKPHNYAGHGADKHFGMFWPTTVIRGKAMAHTGPAPRTGRNITCTARASPGTA